MGREYAIEHCAQQIRKEAETKIYCTYITDALRMIAKNTAGLCGGEYPSERYTKLIDFTPVKEETRSPDEIINQVKNAILKTGGGAKN